MFGSNRLPTTTWTIKGQKVEAVKKHLHLGILRSTAPSTTSRTSRHINLGRSSFFVLNRTGTRFGCLHPITALRLYTSIFLPKMLYGAELWSLSNTELEMLERSHRKILRTIQGLPIRCPKESACWYPLGCSTIADLITTKKLSFLLSIAALPPEALPRQVLLCRLQKSKAHIKSWIPGITNQWLELTWHCHISSKYSFKELLEKMH